MIQDMLIQTRNALIYSDLALFVLDAREGITYNDVALYKWLHYHKLRLPHINKNILAQQDLPVSEEERYQQILLEEEKFMRNSDTTKGGAIIT